MVGLGALSWEARVEGAVGTGDLTSSIRVLKISPLILTYKHHSRNPMFWTCMERS